jgi:triosephosphate isomerase (TIM)
MLILNLKTYPESTGDNLNNLINAINNVVIKYPQISNQIFVAPPFTHLSSLKEKYSEINFITQHVDAIEAGSTTGWIPVQNVMSIGLSYTLLNHSEHRVDSSSLLDKIKFIQEKGMKVVVCCENMDEAQSLLSVNPFGIAYEPKELIGSGKSVSTEKPEIVKEFIEICKDKTNALIGAGISNEVDVKLGLDMGAKGFLLASAFVKAEDPEKKLEELIAPYLNK